MQLTQKTVFGRLSFCIYKQALWCHSCLECKIRGGPAKSCTLIGCCQATFAVRLHVALTAVVTEGPT